ncbi:MAG TPA: VanW family protein [Candidatus Corynebacterium gallistercoris]|uniref:VanW family protein n=1 Tax=Candidatus Corynebacterium gallistercoris TaxID=2838530 RepID=A0A9D1UP27_9CORY|nr:VanW family protein [Candidatus Corynebacterium gallistercoris]
MPWWGWVFLGLLGLGGVLYGVDYAMSEGRVPRGVTVGGVDIGGMTESQAEQRLRLDLGEQVREPVRIHAGNMDSSLEPTQSGLQVDWEATVDQAGQQPLNPITRIRSFWETREVGIISKVTDEPLNRAMNRVTRELTRDAENAELSVNAEGRAEVKDDVPGQTVDRDALRANVVDNWLNKERLITQEADVVEATIRKDAAEKAVKDVVEPATSGNLIFHGRDGVDGVITPQNMHTILSFAPDEEAKGFRPEWNTDAAQEILAEQLNGTEVQYRDASFDFSGGGLAVVPSQDGVAIKWDDTLADFQGKALAKDAREFDVVYEDKPAKYTTEQAQKAHFNDVVGEFTTGGFSSASGVNIRRVAQMVTGAIVLPGETFSLNGYTGPRGTAQGFVESGIIIDGHASEAVGGGISQFATTLYNASYFAGMDDVAHTPHSYYISRYPAGREATVYEGAIDLKFRNPFDTPVRITASADSSSVTVQMHGVKQVNVESIAGPRTNPTSPQRMELSGDKCTPSSGAPGFTTSDTRVIRNLDGSERSRKTTTTVYDPQPIVTCK